MPEYITKKQAEDFVYREDSPTYLVTYTDDRREVEAERETIVSREEQSRRNLPRFDYRFALTVIAQAEQITKKDLSIEGLKTFVEVNQSLIDSTVESAGLSHMVQEDGDGDWSTIWDLIWQKLEAHETQAGQIAMLEARYVQHYEQIERLQEAVRYAKVYSDSAALHIDTIITPQDMETLK